MKKLIRVVFCLSLFLVLTGCASNTISARQEYRGDSLARPSHIFVYDFAATPADVPPESALAAEYSAHPAPQTPEEIAAGRQLGAVIAQQLADKIRAMRLPAERVSGGVQAQINDLVIRGYLVSFDAGSAEKRIAIGFGSGASDLKATVEGFQMTEHGLRKLGGGTVDSGGSKSPGAALGVAGAMVMRRRSHVWNVGKRLACRYPYKPLNFFMVKKDETTSNNACFYSVCRHCTYALGMRDTYQREACRHPDRLSNSYRECAFVGRAVGSIEHRSQTAGAAGPVRCRAGGGIGRTA
ncbi:MAG: DUF4410 domain-containing protein [Gammaproteobacteria bacterium]